MRKRTIKYVGLVAALLLALSVSANAQDAMTPLDIPMIDDMEALQPGETAPDFTLKNPAGEAFAFTAKGEKVHLLVFWSIFCEPCRAEMPLIQALYDRHKAEGFEVVSVALDGDLADNISQFAKQGKFTFNILLDEESEDGSLVVAEDYMVPGTPTIYIVDKEGVITLAKVGRVSEEELEGAILKALGK